MSLLNACDFVSTLAINFWWGLKPCDSRDIDSWISSLSISAAVYSQLCLPDRLGSNTAQK
jgi:hypothetical protein